MPLPLEINLRARNRVGLKITDYPGVSDRQARKNIVAAIGNRIPCISGEYINDITINRVAAAWDETESQMATDGIVWATANVVGGTSTYIVLKNQPVCLDPTTGKYVTGVDPAWQGDEFFIVGTALKSWLGPGTMKIPIKLTPPPAKQDTVLYIGVSVPEDNGSLGNPLSLAYPSFEDWCKGIYYHNTWRFALTNPISNGLSAIGLDTGGYGGVPMPLPYEHVVYARNIDGCYYLHQNQAVIIAKTGSEAFHFHYTDNKVYVGTLQDDLPAGGGPVEMHIGQSPNVLVVWVYAGVGTTPWAIPSGSVVSCQITTNEMRDQIGRERLRFIVTGADMCPQIISPGGP